MSKVLKPGEGSYEKFELKPFEEVKEAAERKKIRAVRKFKPDFDGVREREFVLGGFDFDYTGGYKREEIAKKTSEEIEKMISDAKNRVNDIEKEAGERGYNDGLKKGKEEAISEFTPVIESLKSSIDSLMKTREEFFSKAEKEMVDLVMLVSSEIILREISRDGEIIADVVRKAVGEIHLKQKITIHVNPADMDNAKKIVGPLIEEVEAVEGVEFVADPKCTPGGCEIETNIGKLDATVENRLMAVHRNLRAQLGKKT